MSLSRHFNWIDLDKFENDFEKKSPSTPIYIRRYSAAAADILLLVPPSATPYARIISTTTSLYGGPCLPYDHVTDGTYFTGDFKTLRGLLEAMTEKEKVKFQRNKFKKLHSSWFSEKRKHKFAICNDKI